ncbi:MAG: hypothetical protein IPQ09_13955 [Myxococcales bacterium]|nr:hypothetical protein [Myxococcales bacterium]HQY61729.1 hypothetical protein [Polyangiaceae bacterium]
MRIEVSPSGRAGCRGCKVAIAKGILRFAESYVMPGADQQAFRYWHLECAAKKLGSSLQDALAAYEGEVPEREALEALIRSAPKKTGRDRPLPHADRAPTGRAKCMQCAAQLEKGAWRVAVEREVDAGAFMTRGPGYLHPRCLAAWASEQPSALGDDLIERLLRNTEPTDAERDELLTLLAPD